MDSFKEFISLGKSRYIVLSFSKEVFSTKMELNRNSNLRE
jgi:hypothetical protein